MKKYIHIPQQKFDDKLKEVLKEAGLSYKGSDPSKLDHDEDREYMMQLKLLENKQIDENKKLVAENNKQYFYNKCKKFIDHCKEDSSDLASAHIMLNSGCEYLQGLKEQYGKMLDKLQQENPLNTVLSQDIQ